MLMALAAGASLLGTAFSFFGQQSAAKDQEQAGRIAGRNAARKGQAIMDRNAMAAMDRLQEAVEYKRMGDQQVRLIAENASRSRSQIRAQSAARGITVDVGSLQSINDQVTQLAARDMIVTHYNTINQVQKLRTRSRDLIQAGENQVEETFNEGVYARWSASKQAEQTRMQSYATLLSGAGKAFSLANATPSKPTLTGPTPDAARRMQANL